LPVLAFVVAFAVASEVGRGFSPGIKTRRAAASSLPKAGVQPAGRNDPSIVLAFARFRLQTAKNPAKARVKLQPP